MQIFRFEVIKIINAVYEKILDIQKNTLGLQFPFSDRTS